MPKQVERLEDLESRHRNGLIDLLRGARLPRSATALVNRGLAERYEVCNACHKEGCSVARHSGKCARYRFTETGRRVAEDAKAAADAELLAARLAEGTVEVPLWAARVMSGADHFAGLIGEAARMIGEAIEAKDKKESEK